MPQRELLSSDIDSLVESLDSERTVKEVDIFFNASPKLKRLKEFGLNKGIKFGVDRVKFLSSGNSGYHIYLSLLVYSKRGKIKAKIVLIPEFFVSIVVCRLPKSKWLEGAIFAIAHEIAHIQVLQEASSKACEFEKNSCLYEEDLANKLVLQILKENKIRMKKQSFLEHVAAGIKAFPDHSVCLERIRLGSCPRLN